EGDHRCALRRANREPRGVRTSRRRSVGVSHSRRCRRLRDVLRLMYRSNELACPACGGALAYVGGMLPVHGCGACGGAWLGPDAAVHVMRGQGDSIDGEILAAAERAAAAPVARAAVGESS